MSDKVTEEEMSPDASPSEVSKKSGVRRVNNGPVYLIGGVLIAFLLVMVLVASNRAAQQNQPPDMAENQEKADGENASNVSSFANEIVGDQKVGVIPVETVSPPEALNPEQAVFAPGTSSMPILIARPESPDAPPTNSLGDSDNTPLQSTSRTDEIYRIRLAKIQQMEEAVKAKTGVSVVSHQSGSSLGSQHEYGSPLRGSTQTGDSNNQDKILSDLETVERQIDSDLEYTTEIYKTSLKQLQDTMDGGGFVSGGSRPASAEQQPKTTVVTDNSKNIDQFSGSGQDDRWKLSSRPEAPRSIYELRTGFVVPAILISGINSDLPGQIVAQVSENVYDTPTGKYLLVPQGSRLVGAYSSDVAYGQARVLVAWQRIVFPDGKAMDIGAMPGADSAGYAGLSDQVNNHYFRLFGSALLMSGITAGITLSQGQNQQTLGPPSARSALSEALGQQLGQVTVQLIEKNLNISPTLEIRPGYRLSVIVTKDMTFYKPYKAFDY